MKKLGTLTAMIMIAGIAQGADNLEKKRVAARELHAQLATSSTDALAKLNSSGAASTACVGDLPQDLQQEIQRIIKLQEQADAASKEADDFAKALKATEEAAAHNNNQ